MLDTLDLDFFRWDVLAPFVVKGLAYSMWLTVVATLGGIGFGTVLALARMLGKPALERSIAVYVNIMRSVPLVMVLLWFFLIIPFVTGRPVGAEMSAIVTFIAFEAAYFSEIVRAGIQAISRGQFNAGFALGMTYGQNMRFIVLPQAFRNMLPVLLTQTIVLFQDTSLVYVLSIPDFLGAASKVAQRDGRLVEMYLFAALVYFTISCVASLAVRRLQARIAIVR